MRFSKHYTLEQARALLPVVRKNLEELDACRQRLISLDERVGAMASNGADVGGETVNRLVGAIAQFQRILRQFRDRQIQIKDLDRGLVDFPSLREGREVFLCWEKEEDDIEFWHDLESGYAGRERL
ncbi:MAG: DUF2203 domain-containing protein [Verrucomicrobiota bacterium]|jgi:hypothetical protein